MNQKQNTTQEAFNQRLEILERFMDDVRQRELIEQGRQQERERFKNIALDLFWKLGVPAGVALLTIYVTNYLKS